MSMRMPLLKVCINVLFALLCLSLSHPGFGEDVDRRGSLLPSDLACPGCNVIFLNIELLRADHVGLISGSGLTPNIDDFFRNGIIFHDVSAPAGETFLSNTAVLTVTPPHSIDIRAISIDNFDDISEEQRTAIERELRTLTSVAEVLRTHGYFTIGINQGGRAGSHAFLDRGFIHFGQWSSKLLFSDMTSLLVRELDQVHEAPIFVLFRPTFLHQQQYRRPTAPEALAAAGVRIRTYRYVSPDGRQERGVLLKRRRLAGEETERKTERMIYRSQIQYGDAELASVFKLLEERYVDNSIIVLYANHGSGLGDNGNFRHGTSYQSSIHVPLLIRHPKIDHAIHVESPVPLLSLVPTIYKMLNIPMDRTSTVDTLDSMVAEKRNDDQLLIGRNSWDEYVRRGDWKLIIEYDRIKSLFNLKEDPREEYNLYDTNVEKARELESLLLQYKRHLN